MSRPSLIGPVIEAVREPERPYIDPGRLLNLTDLQVKDLAAAAGVDRNTVARNPHNVRLQNYMREIVRVLESARDIAGDLDRAVIWFKHQPIQAYRFRTAAELVAEGKVEAVMAYLDDMRHGTYA